MPCNHKLLAALILGAALCPLSAQAKSPSGRLELAQVDPPLPAATRKSARDPFVNLVESSPGHPRPLPRPDPTHHHKPSPRPQVVKATIDVPPPPVQVRGVILSASGNQAILTSPTQTYLVRPGDKLGDYKVAAVQSKGVLLRFQDKTFAISMKDEFTAMASPHRKK